MSINQRYNSYIERGFNGPILKPNIGLTFINLGNKGSRFPITKNMRRSHRQAKGHAKYREDLMEQYSNQIPDQISSELDIKEADFRL